MLRLTRIFSTFLIFLLLCALSFAQSFRGGIEGTVTDSSGAAVPAATITVTATGTGLSRTALTDNQGNYFVNELPQGTYKVAATQTGFRKETVTGVPITVANRQRVDITLSAGQVSEIVEVTADVPLVESSSNNQGGVISSQQVENLPVNGRDFTKLLVQVPGATGDPSGAGDSPGSFGLFSINGNRGRSNNYLLDGTDMNDGYRNLPDINEGGVFGTPSTILPVDAIAELPIISGGEAEYGRNSGAIVNIVTKSGTNDWHGSVFEYFRNNKLDARNWFNKAPAIQDRFNNNQFGGSFGGPIVRDKTFFFVSYEGQRENGSVPNSATVPTQGDVANFVAGGGIVNPVIATLLARNPWSVPLLPGPAGGATIQVQDPFKNHIDNMIVKIDQHLRANKDLLTGRYFYGNSDQSFPLGLVGGSATPGYNTLTPTTVNVLSLSYTFVATPKLLVEFRGGYNHFFETFLPQDSNFNPGSIGLNNGVSNTRDFGLPLIKVSGYSNIGATAGINRGRTDANTGIFNNYSYTYGSHNLKWGYEYRRTTVDQFFDANHRGTLKFSSIANFLAGTPTGGSQAAGVSDRSTFQNNHAFYAQDNWKASRRLTLNLGLRWDYFGVIGEQKNRFSIFDPVKGLQPVGQLYPRDLNNFSPRASFAWDVAGDTKTVLRAGWGLFYDDFSQDFFIGQLPFNTSNPGPAYNGIGVNPILFGSANGAPIASGAPLFGGFCGCDIFTVAQNIRTPYVQNYNLNLEHQFTNMLAVEVGYVGSSGRKLFRYVDINQGKTDNAGNFTQPFSGVVLPSPPNPPGSAPFYINQFQSSASSTFHALQVSGKVRSWKGLNAALNYTWSHSIDNASDGQDYVPNATQPDNSFNPAAERANSNFDTRNRLTLNYTYDLPNSSRARWLTNGWETDGILTIASGQPFTVNSFASLNGTQEFVERPDIIGNPFAGTTGGPSAFLNLAAFAAPCNWDPALGGCATGIGLNTNGTPRDGVFTGYHFGNARRNAFTGTNYRNFDFSLAKSIRISERVNMHLRADFFNIFNHPNFANPLLPNFLVDFTQNGTASTCLVAAVGCRGTGTGFLPLFATPDVGIGDPFVGSGGARNIQLALRFTF